MLGLFGLLMVIAVIRLIFWVITIVAVPPGIWIFPNLFADVGFVESFIPLWAWDEPPAKKPRESKPKKSKKKSKARAAEKAPVAEPPAEEPTAPKEPEADAPFDDVN